VRDAPWASAGRTRMGAPGQTFAPLSEYLDSRRSERASSASDALIRMVPSQPLIDMFHLFAIGFVWARCSLPLAPLRVR
jgi:hypothetical protein